MTITVSVPDQLGQQAAAQGLSVEAFVERLAQQAIHQPTKPDDGSALPAEPSNLVELFRPLRGLLTDEEVDILFTRNPSTSRPLDLE